MCQKYKKIVNIIFTIILIIYISISLIIIMQINEKNKIYQIRIANYSNTESTKYLHFSIDDTIQIFDDLTKNEKKYKSAFDNNTLKFLKNCHELYGIKVSMYCFYEYGEMKLTNCTDIFKEDFEANSDWLNFGFHVLNPTRNYAELSIQETKEDYNILIQELKRLVGEKSITRTIRMEKFTCNEENAIALKECELGIIGLLGTDSNDKQDYYLDENTNNKLFEEDYYYDDNNEIFIYNTDLRLENIKKLKEELKKVENDENIIVFTHEWVINSKRNIKERIYLHEICKYAIRNNYKFKFPMKYI